MNKLEDEIKKLLTERQAAHERMVEEFDRADANNAFAQPAIATVISQLTESIEQLERFYQLIFGRNLK